MAAKIRSNASSTSATAITGIAVTMMKLVTSVIHVNNGMRMNFMPGARRLTIGVMKFTPPRIELTPRIESPTTQ